MDSVTQAVLGSAVAVAASGQVSKKMVIAGAVLATLPDLDLFVASAHDLERIISHRTWSHSLLLQPLLALFFAFILQKLFAGISFKRLFVMIYLVFATHALLDSFTVFGTYLLWPLDLPSVMISSVFIIDPLYTLPLLLSFFYMFFARRKARAFKFNRWMLIVSSLYLAWGIGAQQYVKSIAKDSFAANGVEVDKLLIVPMAFNTVLWRVVGVNAENYYEGYYSLFSDDTLQTTAIKRNNELLAGLDSAAIAAVDKFSHGFYTVTADNNKLIMQDLRMGFGPMYSFQIVVAEKSSDSEEFHALDFIDSYRLNDYYPNLVGELPPRSTLIKRVWQRIWDTNVRFFP